LRELLLNMAKTDKQRLNVVASVWILHSREPLRRTNARTVHHWVNVKRPTITLHVGQNSLVGRKQADAVLLNNTRKLMTQWKKWLPEREKTRLWIVSCVAVWRVTRAEAVVVGRGHHWRCCRRRWCCSWRSSACDFRSPTHSRSRHSDCWTSRRRRDTGWLRSRRRCRWSSATTWRQQSATWATVERRVRRHHLSLHRTEINVNGQAMGARWFLPPGRGKVSWCRPSNR